MLVASQRQTCPKAPSPNILKNFNRYLGNSQRSPLASPAKPFSAGPELPAPPATQPGPKLDPGSPVPGLATPAEDSPPFVTPVDNCDVAFERQHC